MGQTAGLFRPTSETNTRRESSTPHSYKMTNKDNEMIDIPTVSTHRSHESVSDTNPQAIQKDNEDDIEEDDNADKNNIAGNGGIESSNVTRREAAGSFSSQAETPSSARKRKKAHGQDMHVTMDIISLNGIESYATITNYEDASMGGDEGEGDEENGEPLGEGGIGVHHVLSVILAIASAACILLLYFLVPCPCEPHDWNIQLESVVSRSPIRLFDVNRDGMDDIIFGFGRSLGYSSEEEDEKYCDILNITAPCGGGVLALSGWNGDSLWEAKTNQTITSLICNQLDANADGQMDCLAAGHGGQIMAIDTRTGALLWNADPSVTISSWSYFQPQTLPIDLDGDGVLDIMVTHGQEVISEQDNDTAPGRLMLLSGKTGMTLGSYFEMPDGQVTRCPPIVYQGSDDTDLHILFGSGGSSQQGSMWMIAVDRLYCQITGSSCDTSTSSGQYRPARSSGPSRLFNTDGNVVELVRGNQSGFVLPAIVTDMTQDGVNDIIMTSHDAHITVINGSTLEPAWSVDRYSASHQVLSLPAPGHFNQDDIPDLLVRLIAMAPSGGEQDKIVILDGSNGEELWYTVRMISDLPLLESSPLSLKASQNKDAFTFWLDTPYNNDTEAATQAGDADWCSEYTTSLSTPSLVMMDRDMAFSPALLTAMSSYLHDSNTTESTQTTHSTTILPMSTAATDHMTTAVITDATSTVVLDITSMLSGSPDAGNEGSPSISNSSSSSSSSQLAGGLRRRREVAVSDEPDCVKMEPTPTSTGVIGDFDDDGTLEYVAAFNVISSAAENTAPLLQSPQSYLLIKRFGLKEALDEDVRMDLAGEDTFLSPSVENSTFTGNLFGHFRFSATRLQTWMAHMGTNGDGYY